MTNGDDILFIKLTQTLIALEDWNAIQETLHILQVPGMREEKRVVKVLSMWTHYE
ncbi:hypothetical protein IQ274_32935 [Nostoc sp. LEGE 12447]|uniref:hypothetical protein n=1 Tax=Nostoc sp. LEGE 12447 TaxID=1828640 RepID=UPI0018848B1A|nr:hypothetical protein [Nostoc sp. LEGE 12447]MBE9002863.1 hypothetical protein [Nostoc sp. LEGE 12447]